MPFLRPESFVLTTLYCCITAYGAKSIELSENLSHENYEELYRLGREAYLENNFEECVKYIEASLRDYKEYNDLVNQCRLKCKKSVPYKPVIQFTKEYNHYESLIRETLCLMNCKRGKTNPNRSEEIIDKKLVQDFETLKTYDYLQLCYYKTKKFQEAANTAYTYTLHYPEHEIMSENLQYYLNIQGVEPEELVNLLEPAFWSAFQQGRIFYVNEDYENMVNSIEKALKLFIQEEEICRVQCEKPFDMGWYPDFVSSVSNHFTFCLKCKLNCATSLHYLQSSEDEDLMPLFFHYLQFGYFKLMDFKSAADCSLSYLQLRPDSEDMQNNLNYYRVASEGYTGNIREDAKKYIDRERDELALLEFIEKSFVFDDKSTAASDVKTRTNIPESEQLITTESTTETTTDQHLHTAQEEDSDEMWVEWSANREEYVFQEDEEDDIMDEFRTRLLSPPPIVKFEL